MYWVKNRLTAGCVYACVVFLSALFSRSTHAAPGDRDFFGAIGDFNVYVMGNVDYDYTDIGGRMAAGGYADLKGLSVGTSLSNSGGTRDDLIVGETLDYTSGTVFNGNVVSRGTGTLTWVNIPNGTYRQQDPAPFDFWFENFAAQKMADQWSTLPSNGNTRITRYPWTTDINFVGIDHSINIFNLSCSDLYKAGSVAINIPGGATALINVKGTSCRMQYFGISLVGATAHNVMWNFYQATALAIRGIGVKGSILAPYAAIDFPYGNIDGTLVSASLSGSGEAHNYHFDSELPPWDDRNLMPIDSNLPWGAIGFIDNGCTGTLIDSEHVLAAAHCFIYDYDALMWDGTQYRQGDFQDPLVFFPNYHPDRPNPVGHEIDRIVVGSRVLDGGAEGYFAASDWGIAHLAVPVTDFPSMAISPVPSTDYPVDVTFAGYARDYRWFPDGSASYPQPSPGGFCPYFGGNCWWIPATIDPHCMALNDAGDFVNFDSTTCTVIGGNSGSPIMWNVGTSGTPEYNIMGVIHGGGGGPSAFHFVDAPRYASNVALATCDDGGDCTQVFATDHDTDRVVRRVREGLGANDPFSHFGTLGYLTAPLEMAAYKLTDNRPAIFVISGDGTLFSAHVNAGGAWEGWFGVDLPLGVSELLDVDMAYDVNGVNQLYVIGDDGYPYTRRRVSSDPYAAWGEWELLTDIAMYDRITSIRRADGTQQIFLSDVSGDLHTMYQLEAAPNSAWSSVESFSLPDELAPIADLDAAWTEYEGVQVFAVDDNGELWTKSMISEWPGDGWGVWQPWSRTLWAPQSAAPPDIEGIVTLTASRWQEQTGGDIVPAVFATDDQGNIYYTTHSVADGWTPWKSFYN